MPSPLRLSAPSALASSLAAPLVAFALLASATAPAGAAIGFVEGWRLPAGAQSKDVALGDVDGDGDLDAYVAGFFGPDTLWWNDGTGNFAADPTAFDSGNGSCAELAPLDAGASIDLWLTRHLAPQRVWKNDGTGTLVDSNQSVGGSTSRVGCALGDLDGDGDRDAFVPTDSNAVANEVYLNDGAGNFAAGAAPVGNFSSRDVALGDVDGDGDLDALLANNGANKLFLNDGAAHFTNSGQSVGLRGSFGVELGDLDGDGDLDAFVANGATPGEPNEIFRNDGTGNFTSSGLALGNDVSFAAVLFDCDDDGDLDAAVANAATQPNRLYRNDAGGVFVDAGVALGVGGADDLAVGDLDGDGSDDLFLANRTQPDQVFLGDGECGFAASGQLLGASTGESIALGDIDGDGDRDLALGTDGGIVRIFRNVDSGTGAFTDDDQWLAGSVGSIASRVRFTDFDRDGDLDLWVGFCCTGAAAPDDPGDRLFWNDGSGHFSDSGQLLGSDYTIGAAVGDVDGDGDADLVAAVFPSFFSPGTNRLYRNDGAGHLVADAQALGTGNNVAVALARLDGDADLDLFVAVRGAGSRVWSNDGAGVFTDSGQAMGTAQTAAVDLADLDGDGDVDAFLGNLGANTVWKNDGTGHFTDTGQALGTRATVAVHLLDVDRDGDLDAWTTNGGAGSPEPVEIWWNDGTGTFSASGLVAGSGIFAESALGDVDRDGDADVVLAGFFGDHQAWLNLAASPLFSDGFEAGSTLFWSATFP